MWLGPLLIALGLISSAPGGIAATMLLRRGRVRLSVAAACGPVAVGLAAAAATGASRHIVAFLAVFQLGGLVAGLAVGTRLLVRRDRRRARDESAGATRPLHRS